ncbi:MAG: 1,4-alpha-glucan branching protein GlgB [Clostridia bacterium]|nr:1,4-alpha-glucan branching protein GlgB [Clostridia bacterium]
MENTNNGAAYLFHEGTNYKAFEYFGAHRDGDGYVFRVWAPNTTAAYVVGLFNGWSEEDPMTRVDDAGVWEAHISADRFGDGYAYKYKFKAPYGDVYKCDPYGFYSEVPPETASRFFDISGYKWHDSKWIKARKNKFTRENLISQPMNIYELHAESWKKHEDGTFLTYKELAEELAPYAVQMGYTHVELMPMSEYPYGGSWGYQVVGYYSPTSRFGDPHGFMEFVDIMHQAGIGVIMDWVPAHFPKDAHGLCEFDGGYVYEYQGQDRMEQADWGTRRFDVGRPEVQSFLVSNAMYWAEMFHCDGLRVDSVASMLYLDYGKRDGEWVPNVYGDHRCLEAIAFFQKLNSAMVTYHPDVMMIAEESTAWADITTFDRDGLGFSMKWNMGWMNDTLSYMCLDPYFRKYNHDKVTFPMCYAYAEKFVLPISHDEVVHGKGSLINKMPGDYDQKFAGARTFMTYMMTQPGKKLMFMGGEIGQFDEWNYADSIQWFLLDFEKHSKYQLFCAELNNLYLKTPALWENDGGWEGFSWIDSENRDQSILAYRRIDKSGNEIIVVLNFTPVEREDFAVGVPFAGTYEEILASDNERFGGEGKLNGKVRSVNEPAHGLDQCIKITLPAHSACVFKCVRKAAPRKKAEPKEKAPAKKAAAKKEQK